MLCSICNQNEATIHIQEIVNNKKQSLHICHDCAVKKGIENADMTSINIAEILYKLSAVKDNSNMSISEESDINSKIETSAPAVLMCGKCGWDVRKFKQTGRLGCEECYRSFASLLTETLMNMHRGPIHTGKKPLISNIGDTSSLLDIMTLQKKLEQHIQREEYEEAAKVRDKINELRLNPSAGKGNE